MEYNRMIKESENAYIKVIYVQKENQYDVNIEIN